MLPVVMRASSYSGWEFFPIEGGGKLSFEEWPWRYIVGAFDPKKVQQSILWY